MHRKVRVWLVASLFSNRSSQVFKLIENPQKIHENYEEKYKIYSAWLLFSDDNRILSHQWLKTLILAALSLNIWRQISLSRYLWAESLLLYFKGGSLLSWLWYCICICTKNNRILFLAYIPNKLKKFNIGTRKTWSCLCFFLFSIGLKVRQRFNIY